MASPQSPEDRQKKRIKELDEKWKMLFNERPRPPLYSVDKYIEYLRKFTTLPNLDQSTNSKGSTRSRSYEPSAGQQVSYLLKKLKLDLKLSYERFLENFICDPNNGLVLLLTLLKNIQKTTRENPRGSVKEKMQSKKRLMTEELECVLCIKFCLRFMDSAKILLEVPYGLENVAEVLLSPNIRSRCTALEIMSKVLMEDEGFPRNLECFTYFRLKNCEPMRFKFLINMLMTAGSSNIQVSFQLCCMKYINSLLTSSPDGNTRIFLQSEVEMAGLDVKALMKSVEKKSSSEKEELLQEIVDYRNSLLDVDQLLESHETLYRLNVELHQKVLELQDQLQLTRQLQNDDEANTIVNDVDHVSDKESEALQGLDELDELLDSIESESDILAEESCAISPKIIRRGSNRNWKKAGHQLPILQRKTKDLDTQNDVNTENHDSKEENSDIMDVVISTAENEKERQKIQFIEKSRAEKFVSLKTNLGLSPEETIMCLQNCDLENMSIGNVSTLLDLLPTENEMRYILSLDCELDHLDIAEQFLVQIMSVQRLEEKLKIMIFAHQFRTLIGCMCQDVNEIKESSTSLIMCHDFQELLELIKGYMVDNYYTTPLDFRLSSLSTLETTTLNITSQTLLEYIVNLVNTTHPNLLFWYKELSIRISSKVSFQRFSKFISETKEGLCAIEREQSIDPTEHLDRLYGSLRHSFDEFYHNFIEMESLYRDVCSLFKENTTVLDPPQFFDYVTTFIDSYKEIDERLPPKQTLPQQAPEPDPDYMSEKGIKDVDDMSPSDDESKILSGELTLSDLESFGLNITKPVDETERIKNWIVMTTPSPSLNIEVIGDRCNKKWCQSNQQESESSDSAFEGSGGHGLKQYIDISTENSEQQRTSTPVITNTLVDEPPPDYSRSNSPDLQEKHLDDLGSEVSRILRDFEGDLNGYETHLSCPVNRRFYTIRSIIHL